jgi:carbonic anhydrase
MRTLFCLSALCFAFLGFGDHAKSPSLSKPLKRLMDGNRRYMADQTSNPDRNAYRRQEVAKKQNPFAVIVGCSDSRVPPEIIFDEGIGDLFTVRVAGNVVGPLELDSVEYATEYLGATLVLVLGHESCGAVTTVLKGDLDDIEDVAQLILPAIQNIPTNDVEAAVKANVKSTVNYLKQTTLLKQSVSQGKIEIQGAYYHLVTGRVELL